MRKILKKELCCGCGACAAVCQTGAVNMVQDREGFRYPKIDRRRCVECHRCKEVCPLQNQVAADGKHRYFGVQVKNETIRYSSSSGGLFSVLAEYVIRLNGVVYGAGYDKDMRVVHQEVKELAQLKQIRGTKYVQSDMKEIYRSVETYLKEERWVLFCGTPCQAHALRLFLKKSYTKLILVDLVCYGVPSPGIWNDYVKYLERKYNGKMRKFLFRDKRNQDNGHVCSCMIDDTEYVRKLNEDDYCRLYFQNYIIRPSCHRCKFCTVERDSDLTIGDFWGIEWVRPDMNDGMGTSLMILHTDKAGTIWEEIKQYVRSFECRKEELLQPRLVAPANAAKGRWMFMLLYRVLPFPLILKLSDWGVRLGRLKKNGNVQVFGRSFRERR